ncbi:MAG: hypothetical protein E6G94_10520 [Alphaproteobacteria bacterium]|nr:MAG: hypothetical protein E6G94_10520 [Alphaproteobacteria bacterium]
MKSLAYLLTALALTAAAPPPKPFADALKEVRYQLQVGANGLSGTGADLLREAIREPRFVFIGEDHVTREIPLFASALCDILKPSALVLEVGPIALGAVEPMLNAPDRDAKMAKFNADYPSSIAFLDTRADNDMAAHCLAASRPPKLAGTDQEFLGSAGLVLDRILATRLTPAARAAVERLRAVEKKYAADATKSGNPGDLLVIRGKPADFAEAEAALAKGGTLAARAMLDQLRKSGEIYRMGGNQGNVVRASLLKHNLKAGLPATGKVLLKFGDWHAYRGYNPLGNRDLGNYVAELADGEGTSSLHIMILGAKRTHALYAGYKRPFTHKPFTMVEDPSYGWFKTAADSQLPGGWTLFDLRPLQHARLTDIDPNWRKVLDGFDLLIVIPELTPSEEM